jgi:hypothetical protein
VPNNVDKISAAALAAHHRPRDPLRRLGSAGSVTDHPHSHVAVVGGFFAPGAVPSTSSPFRGAFGPAARLRRGRHNRLRSGHLSRRGRSSPHGSRAIFGGSSSNRARCPWRDSVGSELCRHLSRRRPVTLARDEGDSDWSDLT